MSWRVSIGLLQVLWMRPVTCIMQLGTALSPLPSPLFPFDAKFAVTATDVILRNLSRVMLSALRFGLCGGLALNTFLGLRQFFSVVSASEKQGPDAWHPGQAKLKHLRWNLLHTLHSSQSSRLNIRHQAAYGWATQSVLIEGLLDGPDSFWGVCTYVLIISTCPPP